MNRTPFAPGEWYHCYNRGVDKRLIFQEQRNYERFLMLLYVSNSKDRIHLSDFGQSRQGPTLPEVLVAERGASLVDIGAYCLMPNHFHLLLRPVEENGISLFMQKVTTGYTMYFNKSNERTGVLLQGKFKSKHVDSDGYFRRVLNYIHANPAELFEPNWKRGVIKNEKELINYLSSYEFSSLPAYLENIENRIINKSSIVDMLEKLPILQNLIEEAQIFATDEKRQGRTLP